MTVDHETIHATINHPFFVVGYGFKPAGDLETGDRLQLIDGSIKEVADVEVEHLEEPVKVYNFEVEDWHTYYVSEQGILVHNTCDGPSGQGGNSNGDMLGSNGTQVSSKTTWKNGKTERIDVENPSPGERPGQIHYHDSNNNKYYYDIENNSFYDVKTGQPAPKAIQLKLRDKGFMKGINKALKILGK